MAPWPLCSNLRPDRGSDGGQRPADQARDPQRRGRPRTPAPRAPPATRAAWPGSWPTAGSPRSGPGPSAVVRHALAAGSRRRGVSSSCTCVGVTGRLVADRRSAPPPHRLPKVWRQPCAGPYRVDNLSPGPLGPARAGRPPGGGYLPAARESKWFTVQSSVCPSLPAAVDRDPGDGRRILPPIPRPSGAGAPSPVARRPRIALRSPLGLPARCWARCRARRADRLPSRRRGENPPAPVPPRLTEVGRRIAPKTGPGRPGCCWYRRRLSGRTSATAPRRHPERTQRLHTPLRTGERRSGPPCTSRAPAAPQRGRVKGGRPAAAARDPSAAGRRSCPPGRVLHRGPQAPRTGRPRGWLLVGPWGRGRRKWRAPHLGGLPSSAS